jgi:hypothetical protein
MSDRVPDPIPFLKAESASSVQWLMELRLDLQANGRIYLNSKIAES